MGRVFPFRIAHQGWNSRDSSPFKPSALECHDREYTLFGMGGVGRYGDTDRPFFQETVGTDTCFGNREGNSGLINSCHQFSDGIVQG